jgi:GxxExxY protein
MDTNRHESLLKDPDLPHGALVYSIVGAAFEVMKGLGHGLHEKPYENAMVVELRIRELKLDQQLRFNIKYKGVHVGEYVPDLIVASAVVVDTKVIDRITSHEIGQMLNYLRITGLKVGLIINFHKPRLEIERVVL